MKEDIFQSDVFKSLGEDKILLLREIAERIKGKSAMDAMAVIGAYQSKLSAGKPLSDEERKAILAVIRQSMTKEEQQKLDYVLTAIGMK